MVKPGLLVLLTLTVAAMALTRSPAPAAAQAIEPCRFERCGLRLQGEAVFQGLQDERVARLGDLYADLRLLETAGDSAALLARTAARAHQRAALARHLGSVAMLPLYAAYSRPWDDRDIHGDAVWTHVGLAATSLTLAILASQWRRPVGESVSRAVWWYNRDVVAGRVPDTPPPLPPLTPDHFGHSGLAWGAGLAMLGGILISRDDVQRGPALFELVVLPIAGGGVGWLIGRGIERR